MRPKGKDIYLGIEIEFISPYHHRYIEDKLNSNKVLKSFCKLKSDGSINTTYTAKELTILSKVSDLKVKLAMVGAFLKEVDATVNDTCGLHVHIDSRNVNPADIVKNLMVEIEDIEGSVLPARLKNKYCKSVKRNAKTLTKIMDRLGNGQELYERLPVYDDTGTLLRHSWGEPVYRTRYIAGAKTLNRYRSVNILAYQKFKTIEVRCHEGTVNVAEIYNWCMYLYEVAYGKEITKKRYIQQRIRTQGKYEAQRIA